MLLKLKLGRKLSQLKYRNNVNDLLNRFEQNGGPDSIKIIKSKIPTYNCIV
jgi:hypothetical protein